MRFKLLERFLTKNGLQNHYYRHVIRDNTRPQFQRDGLIFGDITVKEYDRIAEDLVMTPVDYKNVVGFIQKSTRPDIDRVSYCKYEIPTKTFVSYYYKDNNKKYPIVYTCFKTPLNKYIGKQMSANGWEFVRELSIGE